MLLNVEADPAVNEPLLFARCYILYIIFYNIYINCKIFVYYYALGGQGVDGAGGVPGGG